MSDSVPVNQLSAFLGDHQSDDMLASLLDAVPYALIRTNAQGIIQWANAYASTLFEDECTYMIGQGINDKLHVDAFDYMLKHSQTKVENVYSKVMCEHGTQFILKINARAIQEADGSISGYIIMIENVTERMKHAALHDFFLESEVELMGYSTFGQAGAVMSKAWESLLGWSQEKMDTITFYEVVDPEHHELVSYAFRKVANGLSVSNLIVKSRDRNNNAIWLLYNIVPDLENNRYYFTAHDVTSIQETQAILEAQNHTFKRLYELFANPIISLDEQLHYLLSIGIEQFGMESAIITKKIGNKFRIIYSNDSTGDYRPNTVIPEHKAYCQLTCAQMDILAIPDTSAKPYCDHDASHAVRGSYLGAPVWVGKKNIGTIAFFSDTARDAKFSHADISLMRMMSQLFTGAYGREIEQQELTRIYDLSSDLMAIISFDGYFRRLSPSWQDILGFELSTLYAMRVHKLLHPDDQEQLFEQNIGELSLNETDHIRNITCRMRTINGDYRWVSWNISLLAEENLAYFIGRDITVERLSQIKLIEREQWLRSLLNSMDDMVFTIDAEGYYIDYYIKNEDELYTKPADFMGKHVSEVMPPEIASQVSATVSQVIQDGQAQLMQYPLDIGGETRWFDAQISALQNAKNEKSGAIIVVRDITRTKAMENELRNATSRMEAEVKERTKALRRANADLRTFTYIVSHDLRTPLININGYLGELELTTTDIIDHLCRYLNQLPEIEKLIQVIHADLPETVTAIRESVKAVNHLAQAILDLSRIGRRELTLSTIELDELVNGQLPQFSHLIETNNIEVIIEDLPTIEADYFSMSLIIRNLLSNAFKYRHPDRTPKVRVFGYTTPEKVVIGVEDNGRGIHENDYQKVFELFRRAGRLNTHGTGIGLVYAQALANRHQGRIWFESTVDEGSTFYLELPLEPEIQYIDHYQGDIDA